MHEGAYQVKRNKYNSLWLGLVLGLIGPILGYFLFYVLFLADVGSWDDFFKLSKNGNILAKIMSMALLINLLFLAIANSLDKPRTMQGIVFGTLVCGGVIIILKFI